MKDEKKKDNDPRYRITDDFDTVMKKLIKRPRPKKQEAPKGES